MIRYIIKRVAAGSLVLAIVSAIVFGIFYIVPADPARLACGKSCTPELMERIKVALEIDQPLHVQYGRFVKGIFAGRTYLKGTEAELQCGAPCLGYSYQTDLPVTDLLKDRLPATLSIAVSSTPHKAEKLLACDIDGKFETVLKTPGTYIITMQSISWESHEDVAITDLNLNTFILYSTIVS